MEYSYPQQTTSVGEGVAKGAVTGASMGAVAGPWGAAIGGVVGGAVGGISQAKRNKAQKEAQKKLDEALKNRPVYKRQAEFDENVKQAKSVQSMYEPLTKTNTLPGQAYMQNRVDNNAANAVAKAGMEGLTSPSQYAQLLAATTQSQNDATTELGIAGAQNRQNNMANYANVTQNVIGANKDLAREKDVEWDTNVQQPWLASVNMGRDTLNDSVSRNREKSDQETAFALQSLTSILSRVGGMKESGGKGKMALKSSSPSYSADIPATSGTWNNGRYTR